jgi:hypothetical protein
LQRKKEIPFLTVIHADDIRIGVHKKRIFFVPQGHLKIARLKAKTDAG